MAVWMEKWRSMDNFSDGAAKTEEVSGTDSERDEKQESSGNSPPEIDTEFLQRSFLVEGRNANVDRNVVVDENVSSRSK
jgi:hypothetical protein